MAERLSQIRNFLQQYQASDDWQIDAVSGDASFRRYFRVRLHQQHWILMDAPPPEDPKRFADLAEAFAAAGLQVPQVLAADYSLGFLLLTDLGDTVLQHSLTDTNASVWYRKALNLLPAIQQVRQSAQGELPHFDRAFVLRELQIFIDWFLVVHLGQQPDEATQQLLAQTFSQIANVVLAQPQGGMHRDFHSRNLMVLPDDSLAVIDFQDAVCGPLCYDLVSLLRDCYLRWPDALVDELCRTCYQQWQAAQLLPAELSEADFVRGFDWTGLQRHLKVCGIFARLYHRDQKAGYLPDLPRVVGYVADISGRYPELEAFHQWFSRDVLPHFLEGAQCVR